MNEWEKECMVDGEPGRTPIGYSSPLAVVSGFDGQLGPIWCNTLRDMGFRVHGIGLPLCDVSDREKVRYMAERCVRVHGVPKVIVLNAGVDNPPGSTSTFWAEPERILGVNLIGAANVIEAFLPEMLKAGAGNVTFIGSMLGFIASDQRNYTPPFDKSWAYGASKGGEWKLCKDLIARYSKDGIVFNMLALSGVEGNQDAGFKERYAAKIPIGRMLRREDFVNEFRTCVSAKVPYDQPLFVGGGYTVW